MTVTIHEKSESKKTEREEENRGENRENGSRKASVPGGGKLWHILLSVLLLANILCLCVMFAGRSVPEPAREKEDGGESYSVNVQLTKEQLSRLSWTGKTWCSYGDSITQEAAWQSYVTEYFGFAKHYNRGIGSSTFAKNDQIWYANEDGSYHSRYGFDGVTEAPEGTTEHEGYLCSSDRIQVSVPEDADLILIMGGTNDMGSNVPLGDLTYPFDETTFQGAVASAVVKIQKKAPGAVVVLASPLGGRGLAGEDGSLPDNRDEEEFAVNDLGLTTKDYRDAMEEVAVTLGIPFIDVYGTTGINQWNRSLYIRDMVHPSEQGGMALARAVIGGLEGIKPNMISRFGGEAGLKMADSAVVKETADGLSAQLNQIQWEKTEADGRVWLTGILPQIFEGSALSVVVSDPDYFRNGTLEISKDGKEWKKLYAGLDYECWGDCLWAELPGTEIGFIRFGHDEDAGFGADGVFRFEFYQGEDVSQPFSCGNGIRKLSASVNGDQVNFMTDHDLTTRWTSGSAQKEGVWVTAELTESCVVDGVRMELSDSVGDFPRVLNIETSEDGESWTEQTAVSQDRIDFSLDPVRCRYLRFTLGTPTEETMANWSVHELILFGGRQ